MSLLCPLTPPLGAGVGLALSLPGRPHPIEISGRVVSVGVVPDHRAAAPQVGIGFGRFLGDGEPAWVAYIAAQVAVGAVI